MRGGITFARLDCKKKIIKEIKTNIIITNQIKSNPGKAVESRERNHKSCMERRVLVSERKSTQTERKQRTDFLEFVQGRNICILFLSALSSAYQRQEASVSSYGLYLNLKR
jgi:hypothetical protein